MRPSARTTKASGGHYISIIVMPCYDTIDKGQREELVRYIKDSILYFYNYVAHENEEKSIRVTGRQSSS